MVASGKAERVGNSCNMKKTYMKPGIHVVPLQLSQIICGTGDVINPGDPNKPAGSRGYGDTDWEEDWEEEWEEGRKRKDEEEW